MIARSLLTLRKGSLIVSCQARPDNPLHGPGFMAAMAQAAEQGGAGGLRAQGAADVAAIRAVSALPLIGLLKREEPGSAVYITPDFAAASAVVAADVIAIDATLRPRAGEAVAVLVGRIHTELGRAVMADIATLEDALAAQAAGADCVATTLSGYTEASPHRCGPDLDLLAAIVARAEVPVIAEGRYETPEQVARAFALGAYAVVVGTAITNPREITRRFVRAAQ
jgi:putative N-acetylmannosamine-6-phosphate epimerase